MKEQLLQTWDIHQNMNELILDTLSEESLECTLSTRGGRTVRQQFIHLHQVRLQWLEVCAKDLFNKQKPLDKNLKLTSAELCQSLRESAKGIGELLERGWEQQGKIKGFKNGLLPLLGYFISHESHHRGNILCTLKQCGQKIPDSVKWGLWEWGK